MNNSQDNLSNNRTLLGHGIVVGILVIILLSIWFGAGGSGSTGQGTGRGSGSGEGNGNGAAVGGDGNDVFNGAGNNANSTAATNTHNTIENQLQPRMEPSGEKDLIYIQKAGIWQVAVEQLSAWSKDRNRVKYPNFGSEGVTVEQVNNNSWLVNGYFMVSDNHRQEFSVTVKVYGNDMYRAEGVKLK